VKENINDYVEVKKSEPFTEYPNVIIYLQHKVMTILSDLGRKNFSTCTFHDGVGVTVYDGKDKTRVFVRPGDSDEYINKKLREA
jgi:hypothetical protein